MKFIVKSIVFLLFHFLFIQCVEDEDVLKRDYPRIKTLSVVDISPDGARFNAEILFRGDFEIISYGFAWGEIRYPNKVNFDRVVYLDNIKDNGFSHNVESTLKNGKWYNVRAFVETKDYTVYGENLAFRSLGSNAPEIFSFFPTSGVVGDTITIKGKNFSYIKNNNNVEIGTGQALVIHSTDTTIQTIVPPTSNGNRDVNIKVSIVGNSNTSSDKFNYIMPLLTNIYPLEGTFGDTIIVSGENFGHSKLMKQVLIGNNEAKIISVTPTKIQFEIPVETKEKSNTIELNFNGTNLSTNNKFLLNAPVIQNFTPTRVSEMNEVITIYGKNFNPIKESNSVLINGLDASVVEAHNDFLKVELPNFLIPSYNVTMKENVNIEVKIAEQTTTSIEKLSIYWDSFYTQKNDFPGMARHNAVAFSIDGYGYFGTGIKGFSQESEVLKDFWKYDASSDQWEKVKDFPGKARTMASAFTIGNNGYVGLGSEKPYLNSIAFETNHLNDFYSYNPSSNRWTEINPLPVIGRHSASSFSINSKGYIIGGYVGEGNPFGNFVTTKQTWEYSPITNHWTQIIDFPVESNEHVGFNVGNIGYIYHYNKLWEFRNNSWKLLPAPNLNSWDLIGFEINGLLYFGLGKSHQVPNILYEFNLNTSESSYIPLEVARHGSSVFVINNKAYIIGGASSEVVLQDVWEFDPNKTPGFRD
ncbi:IPT/TIG domain-containing protein [Peijinzhouia sedimentorum]